MKKRLFAAALVAVMLTGCGSNAGSSGSGTSAQKGNQDKASASLEVQEFHDWNGIDMPFPKGWEVDDIIDRTGMIVLTGGTESDPVYYGMSFDFDDGFQDESKGHTLEELPEELLFSMDIFLYRKCQYDTRHEYSRVGVDSSSEEQFLGFPALCRTGTFNTNGDITINYKAYYAYIDFPEFGDGGKHVPSYWFAYTPSNDKDALELMNQAADLPLTTAKFHTS